MAKTPFSLTHEHKNNEHDHSRLIMWLINKNRSSLKNQLKMHDTKKKSLKKIKRSNIRGECLLLREEKVRLLLGCVEVRVVA